MTTPRLFLAAAALALVLIPQPSAPAAAPPVAPPDDDQLDYLLLASEGPTRLRIHLRAGQRPYTAAWTDWMNRIFDWFDRDGNGILDPSEAARLPMPLTFLNLVQGAVNERGSIPLTALDRDRDGKVTRLELHRYYRENGLPPLQLRLNPAPSNSSEQINRTIFQRLDRNRDGLLSQKELTRLPELLRSLDENEDDLLTPNELNFIADQTPYGAVIAQPLAPPTPSDNSPLLEILPRSSPSFLAGQIVRFYDRNKDGKLSRAEIGLSEERFAPLDRNRDSLLTTNELEPLFQHAPDFVFRIRVGALTPISGFLSRIGLGNPVNPPRVEQLAPSPSASWAAGKLRRFGPDDVQLTLGNTRLRLQSLQMTQYNNPGLREFYLRQFDQLAGKKGHITRDQDTQDPQLRLLFAVFNHADRDGDNKLTRLELRDWFNLAADGMQATSTAQIDDQGRNLFALLDANQNGSLSIREMRQAWERVRPLLSNRDGLHIDDLPRNLSLNLNQGYSGLQLVQALSVAAPQPTTSTWTGGTVPVWFRKMDRNQDNDISPREWIGTAEQFRILDGNGDGLISVDEATHYAARNPARK